MKRLLIAAGAALLSVAVVPAFGQGRPNPGAGSQGTAVERGAPPSPAPSTPSAPAPSSVGSSGGGSGSSSPTGGDHHAVPRGGDSRERSGVARPRSGGTSTGSTAHGGRTGATAGSGGNENDPGVTNYGGNARPRGSHPPQGTAVPRGQGDMSPLPPYWQGNYWDYYYWMPYYGPWGLYFYWDPYMWGDYYYPAPAYGGEAYGGGQAYDYSGENGSLKLKVKPRTAQVYMDGYLVGVVDDFDGVFQSLKTRAGGHRLELRQEGYKPLAVDVMVQPDATTTFRGTLEPLKK